MLRDLVSKYTVHYYWLSRQESGISKEAPIHIDISELSGRSSSFTKLEVRGHLPDVQPWPISQSY